MRIYSALLCATLVLLSAPYLHAQKFNKRFAGFSKSKPIYLEKKDGQKIEGYLSGFKKKEGLITIVKMKDKGGKKLELSASQLQNMYLFPSSYAQIEGILQQNDLVNTAWDESSIDTNLIKQGYAYFEQTLIRIEENTIESILQLVNPHFSKQIKVYDNPNSDTSGLINIGGISLTGAEAESYYIRKTSDIAAYKIYSWDYDEKFAELFGDSKDFMEQYGVDPSWMHIERDIYQFTILSNK